MLDNNKTWLTSRTVSCAAHEQLSSKEKQQLWINPLHCSFVMLTELQVWVDCKILLQERQGCFTAPVIHNVYTSSLNIQIHTCTNTQNSAALKGWKMRSWTPGSSFPFPAITVYLSFPHPCISHACWSMFWFLTPSCSKVSLQCCW